MQLDTNLPDGGVELDENGKPIDEQAKLQEMVEKGRKVRTTDDDSTPALHERPQWVPEAFFDPKTGQVNYEGMAARLAELEGSKGPQDPPKAPETPETPTTPEGGQQAPTGTDFSAYVAEFEQSGKLSEASYKALAEKHNLPKDVVDTYLEGVKLQRTTSEEQVLASVGGREAYQQLSQWASQNLSEKELKAYNDQVALSAESAALAVQWLKSRFNEANGQPARLISGNNPAPASKGFATKSDMMKAMSDPRYGRDREYTEDVARKVANRRFAL